MGMVAKSAGYHWILLIPCEIDKVVLFYHSMFKEGLVLGLGLGSVKFRLIVAYISSHQSR